MKSVIVFGLLLTSSCATVSEYNQGCRDGYKWSVNPKNVRDQKVIDDFCNDLDKAHRLEKKEYK